MSISIRHRGNFEKTASFLAKDVKATTCKEA